LKKSWQMEDVRQIVAANAVPGGELERARAAELRAVDGDAAFEIEKMQDVGAGDGARTQTRGRWVKQ
jgi:hypothetical protein